MLRLLSLSFLFLVCVGCATSPEGRSQLQLIPEGQMNQMGEQSFNEIKKQTPISRDSKKTAFVNCVAALVVKQLDGGNYSDWEVRVFDSKDINAFALPGKKIGVYTGILEVAETGGQLAAVLGHEVGHVIANHGNERVSTALVTQVGLAGVGLALDQNNKNHGLLMAALGLGAQFGVLMPHGRSQESESDMIGIELMAKAGFDPHESVRLWENMSRKAGGGPPEWLSTHPSNSTRISHLNSRMGTAMNYYQSSPYKSQASQCRQ